MIITDLELLINELKKLPTITNKTAEKIAYYLSLTDKSEAMKLAEVIKQANDNVHLCNKCNNLTNDQVNMLCSVCQGSNREKNKLCIVSNLPDIKKFESAGIYNGLYYVLHGELSLQKPDDFSCLKLDKLWNNLADIEEIIIATNPTLIGELTARNLKNIILDFNPELKIYRIAVGLPYNSEINYADDFSLEQSLNNKLRMKK